MFILGRLAEDVGVFFSPSNTSRRREIYNEITENINSIFTYAKDCIINSFDYELKCVSLETFSAFLEWATINIDLISLLCNCLCVNEDLNNHTYNVRLLACDCLIIVLNRKGLKADAQEALFTLFDNPNFLIINQLLL